MRICPKLAQVAVDLGSAAAEDYSASAQEKQKGTKTGLYPALNFELASFCSSALSPNSRVTVKKKKKKNLKKLRVLSCRACSVRAATTTQELFTFSLNGA
mmetsp:Transcript_979/g.1896  ORF Transcript_979/g.1896 Transcript_979/m.1896 type:complete len:100 (-) Transcript_979:85-384(-)|eukprot:CAMPEP_0185857224 /NCGR_PEP_ID=MMETSP1354-20130828/29394_1 /TAXON_ID=708628 /ORGANISM="Erythrolobus madagascarensis, Strain CCMP3276" /LENGTH=99 /DNA_ID=CAMNT_0028559491 /DNA_START=142 /DNA_END=441 /DNA_ORIENTATION=+